MAFPAREGAGEFRFLDVDDIGEFGLRAFQQVDRVDGEINRAAGFSAGGAEPLEAVEMEGALGGGRRGAALCVAPPGAIASGAVSLILEGFAPIGRVVAEVMSGGGPFVPAGRFDQRLGEASGFARGGVAELGMGVFVVAMFGGVRFEDGDAGEGLLEVFGNASREKIRGPGPERVLREEALRRGRADVRCRAAAAGGRGSTWAGCGGCGRFP